MYGEPFNQRLCDLHDVSLQVSHWMALLKIDLYILLEPSDGDAVTSETLDLSMSWADRLGVRC